MMDLFNLLLGLKVSESEKEKMDDLRKRTLSGLVKM